MNKIQLIIFAFFLFSLQCVSSANTKIYITTGFTSPVSDFYREVLSEADKRLKNISISFETLPAERSLVLANRGINDGECCRIPTLIINEYNNLVPVNESFFSARFSAFAKQDAIDIKRFEDLKPYSVGTVEGWKIAVKKVKAIKPAQTHIVTTPEQMFHMLDQHRLDYGIMGYLSGLQVITTLNMDNIKAIQPPLVEKPLFLLLHKKHKSLIPKFNKVIKHMKNDGTIDNLYRKLLVNLKQKHNG